MLAYIRGLKPHGFTLLLRKTFRRFYNGEASTFLAELFQNSQRANANEVRIAVKSLPNNQEKYLFTYSDDGTGIEQIGNLLSLGSSSYQAEAVAQQDPMGVGFLALLANENIETLTVVSRGKKIALDCDRWWEDDEYARSTLIAEDIADNPDRDRLTGLTICCTINQKLYEQIDIALDRGKVVSFEKDFYEWSDRDRPARGYYLVGLRIIYQEVAINTGCRFKNRLSAKGYQEKTKILVQDEYLGNNLVVVSNPDYSCHTDGSLTVNWYGQLIWTRLKSLPFEMLLEVTTDTPLTPLAPIRQEIVKDDKFHNFVAFVVNKLRDIFTAPLEEKSEFITPSNVRAYIEIEQTHLKATEPKCPWLLVKEYLPWSRKNEHSEGFERYPDTGDSEVKVIAYEDNPSILLDYLYIVSNGDRDLDHYCEPLEYGIPSFIEDIQQVIGDRPVYKIVECDRDRLLSPPLILYWQPGEKLTDEYNTLYFAGKGKFALSELDLDIDEIERSDRTLGWHQTTQNVCAIEDRSESAPGDCYRFIIGCDTPVAGIQELGWLGFKGYNDTEDKVIYYQSEIDFLIAKFSDRLPSNPDKTNIVNLLEKLHPEEKNRIEEVGITINYLERPCRTTCEIFRIDRGVKDLITEVEIQG